MISKHSWNIHWYQYDDDSGDTNLGMIPPENWVMVSHGPSQWAIPLQEIHLRGSSCQSPRGCSSQNSADTPVPNGRYSHKSPWSSTKMRKNLSTRDYPTLIIFYPYWFMSVWLPAPTSISAHIIPFFCSFPLGRIITSREVYLHKCGRPGAAFIHWRTPPLRAPNRPHLSQTRLFWNVVQTPGSPSWRKCNVRRRCEYQRPWLGSQPGLIHNNHKIKIWTAERLLYIVRSIDKSATHAV